MKTEVIMKRELFGLEISQKSKSEFFSATDLVKAGNLWRLTNGKPIFNLADYMKTKAAKEFITELQGKVGGVIIKGRGRGAHTWVHPFLFIDIALAMSPTLKIETYQWIMDNLLKYRNDSGDSYKKMSGAIMCRLKNKSNFRETISKIAKMVKFECGVSDWQLATEKQLLLRDKIQDSIYLLSDVLTDIDSIVKISIRKAKELVK